MENKNPVPMGYIGDNEIERFNYLVGCLNPIAEQFRTTTRRLGIKNASMSILNKDDISEGMYDIEINSFGDRHDDGFMVYKALTQNQKRTSIGQYYLKTEEENDETLGNKG